MDPIRYGLIGFGGIAEGRIAPEGFALDRERFAPLKEAILVAATSRSGRRRPGAEAFGLRWYETTEELLRDKEIDAVFVASNNLNHSRHGMAALRAGKHLLLDKPITTSRDEAEELLAEAKRRGLSVGVNHMMLHNSLNRKARTLVAEGAIGTVSDIVLHLEFPFGQTSEERASWRCADPAEKGGPIGDVGSHALYVAEFLLGSPVSRLGAVYGPKSLDIAVESSADLRLVFENGCSGRIRVGFDVRDRGLEGTVLGCGYEIYGEKGILRGYGTLGQFSGHPDEAVPIRLELDDFRATTEMEGEKPANMYAAVVRGHASSIISGPRWSGAEALHNLALVLAAYDSAESGGVMLDTFYDRRPSHSGSSPPRRM